MAKTHASQETYLHHFCPECGGEMEYKGGIKKFSCKSCRYERPLQKNSDQVVDRPLASNVNFKKFRRGMGQALKLKEFQCGGCSSIIAVPEEEELEICPFCEGTELEASSRLGKVLEPKDVIPFTIPLERARKILRRYLFKRNYLFLPNSIQQTTRRDRLRGVYLPVFFIDAFTRSTWKGQAGRKVKQNKQDKIFWDPSTGYWEHTFDRMFIEASKGIQMKHFKTIQPYDKFKLVPHDPLYLRDFITEIYQKDEIDGIKSADKQIENEVKRQSEYKRKGDVFKDFKYNRENMLLAFRHVLVPVWIATYQYRGQNFQLMINGQKGFVAGDKPLSMRKIWIAIITGIVSISLMVWLLS